MSTITVIPGDGCLSPGEGFAVPCARCRRCLVVRQELTVLRVGLMRTGTAVRFLCPRCDALTAPPSSNRLERFLTRLGLRRRRRTPAPSEISATIRMRKEVDPDGP